MLHVLPRACALSLPPPPPLSSPPSLSLPPLSPPLASRTPMCVHLLTFNDTPSFPLSHECLLVRACVCDPLHVLNKDHAWKQAAAHYMCAAAHMQAFRVEHSCKNQLSTNLLEKHLHPLNSLQWRAAAYSSDLLSSHPHLAGLLQALEVGHVDAWLQVDLWWHLQWCQPLFPDCDSMGRPPELHLGNIGHDRYH